MRHCVALLMLFACSTASAETPWPLKTPTELRALHGAGFAGFQILTYRVSEQSKQPDKSIVIGIGRDVIIRDDGRTRRVVDFRLGRLYDVDEHRRYVNSPIATEVVFRDTELGNRLGLGKVLSAAGVGDKAADFVEPFWRATELKVTPPNDPPPGVQWQTEREETIALYNGEEVIRWRPKHESLPESVAVNLHRALFWFFNGHPTLNSKLAADGKAPEHLKVHWRGGGVEHIEDYNLVDARWCETCEALEADMRPGLLGGGVFERDLAPVMIAASEGKFRELSSDEYLARIEAALARTDTLQALLWFLERSLQDGSQKCQPSDVDIRCRVQLQLFAQIQTDAEAQTYVRSIGAPSPEHANAIAALRDKAGPNAYYIDLSSVNAMPPSAFAFKQDTQEPLKSAEQRMASALTAMPMVPAVYRDIGNMYFASVLGGRRAWMAWEMGRALAGRSAETNIWRPVDTVEAQTRRRHPEFY